MISAQLNTDDTCMYTSPGHPNQCAHSCYRYKCTLHAPVMQNAVNIIKTIQSEKQMHILYTCENGKRPGAWCIGLNGINKFQNCANVDSINDECCQQQSSSSSMWLEVNCVLAWLGFQHLNWLPVFVHHYHVLPINHDGLSHLTILIN